MRVLEEINLNGRRRLPVILASETAECGLACMAMVGCYYGHNIDLNSIRQRFSFSMAGVTLRGLMRVGDQLGFGTRALRADLEALRHVKTPAILHWDLNHFVVLARATNNSVTIHDPVRGIRTLRFTELSDHFTGIVLEIFPASHFAKIEARTPVKLNGLWSHLGGFWHAAAQVIGLSLALQLAAFAAPLQIQLAVDEAVAKSDVGLLTVLALGFGGLVIAQAAIIALRAWAIQIFGNLLSFQIIANLIRHLLRLPLDYFEKRHIGDILSRITSTTAIQDALTKGFVSAVIDGLMALVTIAILFVYSSTLAGIAVFSFTLKFISALGFYPLIRARTEEQLVASAFERTHIMESVRAASTIKLMGREQERESAWRNLYARVMNSNIELGTLQIGAEMVQSVISGLATVVIIFLGSRAVIYGHGFSVGMLLAFLAYQQTFNDRALSLVNQMTQFRLLDLHLERLSDIVTALPEFISITPISKVNGAIRLVDVSFRYSSSDPWILRNVNLDISVGDYLAITGPSGSGKTTLLKLILGLYDPTEGKILLDEQVATKELWRAWREHVGVVAQDDRLISGSLADNIGFFDPDLNMERVVKVAAQAKIHDDISRMPMKYLSLIGDMGSNLSAGQKQRILLARALYRKPQALFLDEGTANLDSLTEMEIADLISSLPITRLVIAHRPALITRANRVIDMASFKK